MRKEKELMAAAAMPIALCDGEDSTVLILRKKTLTLIRKI